MVASGIIATASCTPRWRTRFAQSQLALPTLPRHYVAMKKTALSWCVLLPLVGALAISQPAFADRDSPSSPVTTGVLDLTLKDLGNGQFVLANSNYQLTFPAKPEVNKQDTPTAAGTIKGALAIQTTDAAGNIGNGFMIVPVPAGVPFDAKAGVKAARDGMMGTLKGKVTKEEQTTIAGLKVTHTIAIGTVDGAKIEVHLWIGFDNAHKALVGLFTLREIGKGADVQSFVDSFKLIGGQAESADGIVKTGFHNVVISPVTGKEGSYLLKGDNYSVVYPAKPNFEQFDVPWPTGANKGAIATAELGDGANAILMTYVPSDVTYDANKGIDGARDNMLATMKAKLTGEKPATIAGFKGRTVFGTMKVKEKNATIRVSFVYLEKRRLVFGIMNLWASGDKIGEANANAFVKSLKLSK
jgi:hypothetical protein